jgi:hypothetical protein
METTEVTSAASTVGDLAASSEAEWAAQPLRPMAHWVSMPTANGGSRLAMVWETPDPMPPYQR